jgi:hypothetical protein
VSIVEHPFPVGALVAPHLHTREDEYSIVTEGEIGFRSGDREVVLGSGGYITKPRGELHAMWNAGKTPARMIEVISPAGFENFFRDLTDLTAVGSQASTRSPRSPMRTACASAKPHGCPTSSRATTSLRRGEQTAARTPGLARGDQADYGRFEEWPGNRLASGLIRTAALFTAIAASPNPTESSRTLPG